MFRKTEKTANQLASSLSSIVDPGGFSFGQCAIALNVAENSCTIEQNYYARCGATISDSVSAEQILRIHWNFGRVTRDETLDAPQGTKQFDYIPGLEGCKSTENMYLRVWVGDPL